MANIPIIAQEHQDYRTGGSEGHAITDQNGNYTISRLPATRYCVKAELLDDLSQKWASPALTHITVDRDRDFEGADLFLTEGAVIEGQVSLSDDQLFASEGRIIDPDGSPVAGVEVSWQNLAFSFPACL